MCSTLMFFSSNKCSLICTLSTYNTHIYTGLLKVGVPQPWPKSKQNLNYVREAGVRQFISTYNRVKNLKGDELLWGDEVEYGIFILDDENKKIRLSLRAKEVCVYMLVLFINVLCNLQHLQCFDVICKHLYLTHLYTSP